MKNRLLTPLQVAERLNVSKRTVYRLLAEACFEAGKIGNSLRITEPSLEAYILQRIEEYSLETGFSVPNDDSCTSLREIERGK